MYLSPHFNYREMVYSYTSTRLHIDNDPIRILDSNEAIQVIANATRVANLLLEPIREEYGPFSPTSWYRGEALEKVITNTAFQQWARNRGVDSWEEYFNKKSHPKGEAVDIKIAGVPTIKVFDFIKRNFEFDQLIAEYYTPDDINSGWVHVSLRMKNNRKQVFEVN